MAPKSSLDTVTHVPGLAHLDTHIVVALCEGDPKRIAPRAQRLMEQTNIAVSYFVILELRYLSEVGRISKSPDDIIRMLRDVLDFEMSHVPLSKIVEKAEALGWTRDVFDRLIVAEAIAAKAKLITKDGVILKHFKNALWD